MDQTKNQFTKLEMFIWITVTLLSGLVIWNEKNLLEASHRDSSRKVAINAIYANLEEVTYPLLTGYPETLEPRLLTAVDPILLKDQNDITIGTLGSEYSYEPSSCNKGICQHFQLRALLEREAPFVQKSSR